jgi:outer membrane protein
MFKFLSAVVISVSLMFSAMAAQAAEQKIGTINVGYVINQIPQTKAAQAKVQKALESKEKALMKIQNEGQALEKSLADQSLSAEVRVKKQREMQLLQTELQVKVSEYREEQQKAMGKEQQEIFKKVEGAIQTVAKQKGLTIVIKADALAYLGDESLDISEEVVALVAKTK